MKKIIVLKHEGGMTLKKKLDIKDKKLKKQFGRKGLRRLAYIHRETIRDLKRNKLVTFSSEEVLEGVQEIIDNAILERNNGI